MEQREREIPALNQIHSNFISSQFLRASVQGGQEGQLVQAETDVERADQGRTDLIDLNASQVDLNSNIQPIYPETSATSFTEEENYYSTGNNSAGNGNEAEQGDDPATNYREMAQNLISQQLASANVDSFALIYNDGTAHFQGSNSTYDLSSIDPIDGANSTIESNENFDDQEPNPEIDWPFRFEN
jgi:hypothetical protein